MVREGGCSCGDIRYRVHAEPLVVHACHCRQCQRVTGSAFVLNAIVEKTEVELLSGEPACHHLASTTHTPYFCAACGTYVWSQYAGRFGGCWFVRVGTLDDPDSCPPDVHIFTASKQPWVVIPDGAPRFDEFYRPKTFLPAASLARMAASQ